MKQIAFQNLNIDIRHVKIWNELIGIYYLKSL